MTASETLGVVMDEDRDGNASASCPWCGAQIMAPGLTDRMIAFMDLHSHQRCLAAKGIGNAIPPHI